MMMEDCRHGRGSWPWLGAVLIVLSCLLTACGSSGGSSEADSSPSHPSARPVTPTPSASSSSTPILPTSPHSTPSTKAPSSPPKEPPTHPGTASASPGCVAGHAQVTVSPGDAPEQRLCVRPGAVVSLVLKPRADDKRWTAVQSSAPVFVVASGWQLDGRGNAHASLRCAGTRGGTAKVTALAKAPDVAGAAKAAFTLDVSVVPYMTQR
jgi:hypothetical protein